MIGICTDSNSQLPPSLAERYSVEVVPITVTIGDHDYLEGVDLEADRFYELLAAEPQPSVSTSPPSPGQFAAAYESLLHRGCDQILSIHVTAAASGTLNSARLASRSLPVPVRLVDSGMAGFGVSCCVWAAAEAVARDATIDEAVQVCEALTPRIGAVFVVGDPSLLDAAGLGPHPGAGDADQHGGLQILSMRDRSVEVVANVSAMADAVETMASMAIGWAPHVKVAVGLAGRTAGPLTEALAAAVGASVNVLEVVRYRIGPSVGVYTGPGAVGCFMFPAE